MWPPDGWRNEGTAEEHAKKITTRLGGDFCDCPQVLLSLNYSFKPLIRF
jgi:hypothetical protein